MKAYQIRDEWSLENLQLVDLPEPVPGPGEVLVEIKAASLNYRDLFVVHRGYAVSYTHLTLPTMS